MTDDRRLTEQGRERKAQLLDAASRLFATHGYETTRIADICEAAGVAKGLFYWYFENKQSLFAELVRDMRLQLRRSQAAAMDPEADALTRLRQGVEASVHFMAEHIEFFALLESGGSDDVIRSVLREGTEVYVTDTARLIVEAQGEGLLPDRDDVRLLAIGVHGAVSHFCHFHRTGRIDMSVGELASFVGGWVNRALGSQRDEPLAAL
jgi:AcrR family transcriptional regulator